MIRKSVSFVSLICLWVAVSHAQDINKQFLKIGGKRYTYYETRSLTPVKGILILLPAAGENPKSIFTKTRLPAAMASLGYVTVAAEIPTELFATQDCIDELNELTKAKLAQYNLLYSNVVLGGLSAGGAVALGYTEYLNALPMPIKLKAVFAIDPPADLSRIYGSAEKEISYNCSILNQEGKRLKAYLDRTLGGAPEANQDSYYKNAVFSAKAADGGNARYLKDAVVRLYCEPDLAFVQKTYCSQFQFSNLNAFDLELLAKFLKENGNNHLQYITTSGRGFHSWNIVDADDFAKWISSYN